jgi:hypothetical protein
MSELSCVGSRAMAGALAADTLDVKLDENSTSFLEVTALWLIFVLEVLWSDGLSLLALDGLLTITLLYCTV